MLRSINVDQNLNPLSEADGVLLVEYRENSGFTDLDDFLVSPVFGEKPEQMEGIKPLLGQNSAYFLLQAEVEVADRNMRLYSVLQRSGRQINALARARGSLDDSQQQTTARREVPIAQLRGQIAHHFFVDYCVIVDCEWSQFFPERSIALVA